MNSEHTPTPWILNGWDQDDATETKYVYIQSEDGRPIASIHRPNPNAKANAALIVRAVNSYEAMREALQVAREYLDNKRDTPDDLSRMLALALTHDEGLQRKVKSSEASERRKAVQS
jgi:hypothetical protein